MNEIVEDSPFEQTEMNLGRSILTTEQKLWLVRQIMSKLSRSAFSIPWEMIRLVSMISL